MLPREGELINGKKMAYPNVDKAFSLMLGQHWQLGRTNN